MQEEKTCQYPGCKETEINEYGNCKNHEPTYKGPTRRFNLKEIQDGLKRMAENAPKHKLTEDEKLRQRVQEELF